MTKHEKFLFIYALQRLDGNIAHIDNFRSKKLYLTFNEYIKLRDKTIKKYKHFDL